MKKITAAIAFAVLLPLVSTAYADKDKRHEKGWDRHHAGYSTHSRDKGWRDHHGYKHDRDHKRVVVIHDGNRHHHRDHYYRHHHHHKHWVPGHWKYRERYGDRVWIPGHWEHRNRW